MRPWWIGIGVCLLVGCPSGDDDDVAGDDDATADDDTALDELVWPNHDSAASSDPWLVEHHAEVRQLRPRVLALNFVNGRSMDEMHGQLAEVVDIMAEASRYHGYADASAPVFLQYELAYEVDLRDAEEPADWPYNNSTLYPREEPVEGYWGFDYEALFGPDFAALYGIEGEDGTVLDLCEAIEQGLVHEVWIYGDADVPDVSAAEILELKPYYDADRQRIDGGMNRCAGNGCFDSQDTFPDHCTRTVRVAWFNNTRGPGCFLESLSHGFESIGAWNPDQLPSLHDDFVRFAGYELDDRYGLPFDSFYACSYSEPCLGYPTETSVEYDTGTHSGAIDPWDAVCGNVHFAPNGRQHYDLASDYTVQTSCEAFGLGGGDGGGDALTAFTTDAFADYTSFAPDCMGPFLVYWRQNFPGLDSGAGDADGEPILNWWPYIYY